MMLEEAMRSACAAVGIKEPRKLVPGQFVRTDTLEHNGKNDATVMIFDDRQGGIAYNWQTQQSQPFSIRGENEASPAPKRDLEKERRQEAERKEVEQICRNILRECRQEVHPYLGAKGFPEEIGLVVDDPAEFLPESKVGRMVKMALPQGDGAFLVVPGRIGNLVTTLQFICPDGAKINIKGGRVSGSAHRIATGRETWVAEGIGTALTIRAALRSLGRSATVLSAFSASNVAKVASAIPGAIIAADHDKPIETLGGLGTGEYYARKSGCKWTMPQVRGDFNDMQQSEGIRAIALHLREEVPP